MENKPLNEQAEKPKGSMKSLLFNIILPVLCLFQLPKLITAATGLERADAGKYGLIIALAFPVGFFLYHFIKERKTSLLAVVGFFGILVTGLIGLLELPREYVAYERAAVPLMIGLVLVLSNFGKNPLVKKMFYNPMMFNTEKIDQLITEKGNQEPFMKTLRNTSFMIAASFVLSSIVNYFVTQHYMGIIEDYNEALGKVKLISLAVIFIPSMIVMIVALMYFMNQLKKLTGVSDSEELYAEQMKEKSK
ncbi:MAG: hypothetical protein MJZ24_05125 [Paludibacteraceae bacterium]|nr:hypothetical protein [Candidatus Physcocola equi]MCQ2234106.1 hypothetical protein [Paludibacteraceae bacterium]